MSEKEPNFNLNLGKLGKLELNRDNSALFSFVGKTALDGYELDNDVVDHIYIRRHSAENPDEERGIYIFKTTTPNYDAIAKYMVKHHFQMHMNMPVVPRGDL